MGARWQSLPQAMALGDSLGPWWVAVRGPWATAPHAPPYGWLLAVPHAAILAVSDDLYSAMAGIRVVDAAVAPLGAWAALRLTGRWLGALAVGLLLALDPSLLDTATSGAETYQAPVAVALLTLGTTARGRRWGPWLAGPAFAWAVMAHPLSLLAAPLLRGVRWTVVSALATGGLLVPHLWALSAQVGGALGPEAALPVPAVSAWAAQSGPAAVLFGVGLLLGVRHRSVRRLGRATAVAVVLMLLAGTRIGYLRDHHLRVFSAPAAVGLAALPGPLALLAAGLALEWPTPDDRPAAHRRPGTLGLLHRTTDAVLAAHRPGQPLVVDGLRTVHTPAVEPGGVWLDLLLRGVPPEHLDATPDSLVVVVVTAERGAAVLTEAPGSGLERLAGRDTWAVVQGRPTAVERWSTELCAQRAAAGLPPPRVGGAWDGLSLVHPERGAAAVDGWWACRRP